MLRPGAAERRKEALAELQTKAGAREGSLAFVDGDLSKPRLGLDDAGLRALADAGHCFHVAALYDIEADAEALARTNIQGTKHLLSALEEARFDGRLHHVSSIAVAGDFAGQTAKRHFGNRIAFSGLSNREELMIHREKGEAYGHDTPLFRRRKET